MSASIVINENATHFMDQLSKEMDPTRILKVLAKAAANTTKAHFRARDRERTGKFGESSHYWNDAAAATTHQSDAGTAKVLVDKEGVGLHYFGGTVVPVVASYLTIPARAEAKGSRAGEFDLNFIPNKNGGARLVDDTGSVWFWLVKSVTLDPDPDVLPTEDQYSLDITNALADSLAAALDRRGAA